jgi:hypothetical protein
VKPVPAEARAEPSEDDLDVIDEIHRHSHALVEARRAVQRVVHRVPVDEQEEVLAGVVREEHPPGSDVRSSQRVGGDDAEAQEIDRLGERPDPVELQILGRDRRRERRRRRRPLRGGRCGRDHLLVEERLDIAGVVGARRQGPGDGRAPRKGRPCARRHR